MKNVAIIIPCYNEGRRLDFLAILEFARAHPSVRFVMVDDGSTDNTPELIAHMQKELPEQIVSVPLSKNSKKPEAVRQGFLKAFTMPVDYIGYWDADLSTPLYHIEQMTELLNEPSVEIVLGSRVRLLGRNVRRSFFRHYSGRGYATLASMTLRLAVYDTQCGSKIFKNTPQIKAIFSFPFTTKWVFDVEILARAILYNKLNATGRDCAMFCVECPLQEWIDKAGSKRNIADYFISVVDLLKILGILYLKNKNSKYTQHLIDR